MPASQKHYLLGINHTGRNALLGIGSILPLNPQKITLEASGALEPTRSFSDRLLFELDSAVRQLEKGWQSLSGLVVAVGPGRFSGIRLSVAIAQTIALCDDLPVVGVNALELAAEACFQRSGGRVPQSVVVLLDAGNQTFYFGRYCRQNSEASWSLSETKLNPELICLKEAMTVMDSLSNAPEATTLCTGSGFQAYPELRLRAEGPQSMVSVIEPNFEDLIRLGAAKCIKQNWLSPYAAVMPLHIERPDRWKKQSPLGQRW